MTHFDIARVRARFPALGDGDAYLDGAAGTQVPTAVIEAISQAYESGIGNVGGAFAASRRSAVLVDECRRAIADLVGGEADGVVLGPNMTTLTYRFASTLASTWSPGDEVVCSRLDHDANIRPWVHAAARVGATVRFAEVDLATGELPVGQYEELVGPRTRLVALSAASNVIGTRPDVASVAAIAHRVGAYCYVDGVHATPHGPTDIVHLGADFYATSAYKWAGPHIGAVIASPALLETLRPDKLAPSSDAVPGRFEWGTAPFADLAGVTAAVEHLASLDAGATGTRRERIVTSMREAVHHELELFAALLTGLEAIAGVTLYGNAASRCPTAYFNLAGYAPSDVAASCARRGVNVWSGDNYAYELTTALGIRESGSAVRAGLVHYTSRRDVERLLEVIDDLARTPSGAR